MNVDLVKQADHTLLVELQLQVFSTGYIITNAAERGRLQPARAWPEYFGRPCYSDIGVARADNETWYGRALLFFQAGKHESMWDERAHQRVPIVVWSDLVFIRWYKKTGYRDTVTCDIYEWKQIAGRTEGPRRGIEALSSVIAVEQLLSKTTGTQDKFMFYLNKYYR
jgi:hypothetical protein